MYNLIISGSADAWEKAHFILSHDRFLEHTEIPLAERLRGLGAEVWEQLKGLPTIFAYERGDAPARVGWITDVRVRQGQIRLAFSFDEAVEPFTTDDLDEHVWEFDINRFETNRTHWAVKDVDLFEALAETGLGGNLQRAAGMAIPPYAALASAEPPAPALEATEIRPTVFQIPPGGRQPDLVAIMMPFSREFDDTHAAIQRACDELGLRGQRADNMWENEALIQDVFALIYRASVVVVDFTDRNPNVFYETGIAHTLGRPVVPITRNAADVPFDVRHNRFQLYVPDDNGLQELTARLSSRLSTLTGRPNLQAG